MNKVLSYTSVLLGALTLSGPAIAANVIEKTDNIYSQKVGRGVSSFFYIVDISTRLCFASPGGGGALTSIDCNKLKSRDDWKKVITW